MTRRSDWKEKAEAYCREQGAEKIIHPNKRYLYDLKGLGNDVTIALFDGDGFLIARCGDLNQTWGEGYFPNGIKTFAGTYVSRAAFEELDRLRR